MNLEMQNVSKETLRAVATALSDGIQVMLRVKDISETRGNKEAAEYTMKQIKGVSDFRETIINTLLREESQ